MSLAEEKLYSVATALRSGKMDLIEYVNRLCDRMDAEEPLIQAFLPEENRRARLLADAKRLLEQYPDAASRPAFFGVPIGVKDLFIVDGFETRAGSKLPAEEFKGKEASCVTKLKEAGALIAGKTVSTEFAYFQPGPTRNPNNTQHTPGGSSSGSAAAVAAGFVPFAFGTQTIGSVSRPAAFCGVIGYKPSYGRIAADGAIPFSVSADHVGFFTQDLEGVALAAPLLCENWDSTQADSDAERLPVLGVPEGAYLQQADPEALQAFEAELKRLESAGFEIKRVSALDDIQEINATHRAMISAELAEAHGNWFDKHRPLYSPTTVEFILEGQQVSKDQLLIAKKGQLELRERFHTIMKEQGIDLFITPSAPGVAPEGIGATGNPAMNLPWTYSGLPTLALPTVKNTKGLPYGIQLAAPFNSDELLLSLCRTITSRK